MNQTALTLLGILCTMVAVLAETRTRKDGEAARERDRDGQYWRESYQVAKAQLANAEVRLDSLEDGFDKLRAWCIEQAEALGAPADSGKRKKGKRE